GRRGHAPLRRRPGRARRARERLRNDRADPPEPAFRDRAAGAGRRSGLAASRRAERGRRASRLGPDAARDPQRAPRHDRRASGRRPARAPARRAKPPGPAPTARSSCRRPRRGGCDAALVRDERARTPRPAHPPQRGGGGVDATCVPTDRRRPLVTGRRITIVASELLGRTGTGGAGTADSLLAVALGRHGHRVELLVASGREIGELSPDWAGTYASAGVEVSRVERLRGVSPAYLGSS